MTLASWVTSVRFILVPFIYWQLSRGSFQGVIWAFVLLLLAAVTDVADGWVARARHEISELGKTLDPLADKLVIFFTLLALAQYWSFPFWIVAIYFCKEILQVIAGIFLLRQYQQLIPANWWGKTATVSFFLGFGVFLLPKYSWNRLTGTIIIALGMLLSIYALFTYYRDYRKLKKK